VGYAINADGAKLPAEGLQAEGDEMWFLEKKSEENVPGAKAHIVEELNGSLSIAF
jgi:hypothetical protein